MSKRLYVIINPASGSGMPDKVLPDVEEQLKQRSIDYVLDVVRTPDEAFKAARGINLKKYDAVAVYGGDGTIIAIFKAIFKQAIPVLILPGGSANVLAKALGLPADVGKCLDLFQGGLYLLRPFGVALANGEPLILDLHFGVWAESIQSTDQETKKRFGQFAYALEAMKQFGSAAKDHYSLRLDGKQLQLEAYACMVANEGFHNVLGVPFFPHPHTRGLLQVAIIKRANKHALLRWLGLRMLGGRDSSVIATWRAKEVVIEHAPSRMIWDDDSVDVILPLTISPSKYAVSAIAPPPAAAAGSFWSRFTFKFKLEYYRLNDHFRRLITGSPSLKSTQIAPNLYVGGQYRPWGVKKLRRWGVTGVVNMRFLHRPSLSAELDILNLPTRNHHPPRLADLHQGVAFIQHHLDKGGGVYVHCQLGEGRGPTMAAAYLISQGMRAQDAVAHIERFRRLVRPNAKQLRRLAEYEAELAGKETV